MNLFLLIPSSFGKLPDGGFDVVLCVITLLHFVHLLRFFSSLFSLFLGGLLFWQQVNLRRISS